jgi:hypothetical protein
MSFQAILLLVAAGLSAAAWRWNSTSAALAFAYLAAQVAWWSGGRVIDVGELFLIDMFTITLIMCKAIVRCPDQDFRTGWEHLRCFVSAPTRWDWIVLAIFPLVWGAYVANVSEYARWWALYGLAMAQFLAAGGEALIEWREAKRAASRGREPPSSGLAFAAGHWRWST